MNTETDNQPDDTELSDSVTSARASNLRETSPELFTGEPKQDATPPEGDAGGDKDADADAAAAAAGDDGDAAGDAATAGGDDNQLIPRARLNEVVREKRTAIEAAEALRVRLEALEQAETDRQTAAAKAAEAPARDIEAELDALEEKFDEGDLDQAEFRTQRKVLERELRAQERDAAVAAALSEVERRNGEQQQQTKAQQWEAASTKFMTDPLNAAYADPIRQGALNQAMKVVLAENGGVMGYDELLEESRLRVEKAFGGDTKPRNESPQDKVTRERRARAALAAAEASSLPDRPIGGVGARGTGEGKEDPEQISREEWRKMSPAEKDKHLGKTPA